ncbi:MAG: hypothetical protein ACJ8DZ_04315 [Allosphingosinicella sp.]
MSIAALPRDPATHLRLALLGAGAALAERIGAAAPAWLGEYAAEIETLAGRRLAADGWSAMVANWAGPASGLPLQRLLGAFDDPLAIDLMLAIGLAGEDARVGALLGDGDRLTLATLTALWRDRGGGGDDPGAVRRIVNLLLHAGLIGVANPEAPRCEWQLSVAAAAWDALAGDPTPPPGCRLLPAAELLPFDRLVAAEPLIDRALLIAEAMAEDPMLVPLLRGPARNGRKTIAGAFARAAGRPLILAEAGLTEQPEAWRQLGLFAFLHDAAVVVTVPVGPGEVREVPGFALEPVRLIVATGACGGVRLAERPQAALLVPAPDFAGRMAHWRAAAPDLDPAGVAALADALWV